MAPPLVPSRRTLLQTLALLPALRLFESRPALAAYGGELSLTLPLDLGWFDPSDPFDLASALLGRNLFEPLYGVHEGAPYPTLALGLPEVVEGKTKVRLRPGMRFASGVPLDARAVVATLERAKKNLRGFLSLPHVTVKDTLTLHFTGSSPQELARLLSDPLLGIVPPQFQPERPDSSGPFRFETRGSKSGELVRNENCPRGGAFLDRVILRSGSLEECLRDFEIGQSAIGYGGLGLHHDRPGAKPTPFGTLGFLVVTGLPSSSPFARAGALHAALGGIGQESLNSLGIRRDSTTGVAPNLAAQAVCERHPLLIAVMDVLASTCQLHLKTQLSSAAHRAGLGTGAAETALVFLRVPESALLERTFVKRALYFLDGEAAPSGSVAEEPPEKLARRLRLGLLGRLIPSGGLDRKVRDGSGTSPFELGNTTVVETARKI